MNVKIQKSQTKAITNHTGTTNYKGVMEHYWGKIMEHYWGKRNLLLLVTGIKRTSNLDLLSDRNTHKQENRLIKLSNVPNGHINQSTEQF